MNNKHLISILDAIGSIKIAVIGDFCLDAYWFIDETRSEISVETNQATRPVGQQKYSLGGAGNVANNLAAMGVKNIRVFGVIGPDPFGAEMVRIMQTHGMDTRNLLVQSELWSTHTYAKPYIDGQELNRVDFGNYNQLDTATADRLIDQLVAEIPEIDLVIINQQVPSGIHTDYLKARLREVIGQFPEKKFIVDSRHFNDYYTGAIRKMNDNEAVRLCGIDRTPDEPVPHTEVVAAAHALYERYGKPLFITRGSKGSLVIDQQGISEIPGLMILAKVDTVGAGDSYLAGAASALAAGYDLSTAANLGALVAGVTVQKLFQTGTANRDEILAIGHYPDYIFHADRAENIRQAVYMPNSEIELITVWANKPSIRYAIFDHDGTISTLREGWELIMAPIMMKAILGDRFADADESLFQKVKSRVDEFIDKTTGIQTLVQMQGLVQLVREFGCVPADQILDAPGYKHLYNQELLEMVKVRENKLLQGDLHINDLTIKNAVPLLQKLHDAGIKLYLASGTDEADVRKEAETLGYAHLFEDRIYGAVGDVTKEAKKMVLDRILTMIGGSAGEQLVTFGDGPVEIRETRKRGGLTVGVASNELRRFGLNEHKRSRLIKAGADVIVPDFSQLSQLLDLLNISH